MKRVLFSGMLLMALVCLPAAFAQSITGQISGTITDASGGVIPGATVKLTNQLTQQVREFSSNESGSFVFPNLMPGDYTVHVAHTGFNEYDQKDITVAAQERVDLHAIKLEVGGVATQVEVTAEAARVATDSSDRAVAITTSMIQNIPSPDRSVVASLQFLPGAQGSTALTGTSGQLVMAVDGIITQNTGSTGQLGGLYQMNVDAVGEMKVMVSNYNAEYGSRTGGTVTVVTKAGSNQFHGSGYYYWRHEQFNANSFFNNKNSVQKARGRYINPGGTIGGPVLIPGTGFNKSRTKLFFFYGYDYLRNKGNSNATYNMPTQAELSGDFSSTRQSNGTVVPIRDPSTGASFPGNKVPQTLFTPMGRAFMALLPTSQGLIDPSGRYGYNSRYQFPNTNFSLAHTLRMDYNIGNNTVIYGKFNKGDHNHNKGVGVGQSGSSNWGQFVNENNGAGTSLAVTLIRSISPTLVSETTVGFNRMAETNHPAETGALDKYALSNFKDPLTGEVVVPTQIYDSYKQFNLIPSFTFGTASPVGAAGLSISNMPAFQWDSRWPFTGADMISNVATNLTWVKGNHNMKFGFNWEHSSRDSDSYSNRNVIGTYYFGSDTTSQYDTNFGYSNLLTGAIQAFGQDNVRQRLQSRYNQEEFYAQDTWKVTRRLSLDLGIRIQVINPNYNQDQIGGMFDGTLYDAARQGTLLVHGCSIVTTGNCPVANRVALNPKTGKTYPRSYSGLMDPLSYGSPATAWTGMRLYDSKIYKVRPPQIGPRVGFAYDVFGNGKLAIRGGFGIFYQRPWIANTLGATGQGVGPIKVPGVTFLAPTFYQQTFDSLATAQPWFSPQSVNGGSPTDYKNPTTYNWSLGVQRDLGGGYVLDLAYVGNVAHHGWGTAYDANSIPPGTYWTPNGGTYNSAVGLWTGTLNPKYLDPWNRNAPLDDNSIRAMMPGGYSGYSSIPSFTSKGESYYHSLQVQVNRRFGKTFTFGSNYVFQKTISYNSNQYLPDAIGKDVSNRKHVLNVNYGWTAPNVSQFVGQNPFATRPAKFVLDGWHFSGTGTWMSGSPLAVSCGLQSAPSGYLAGGITKRCQMVGDLWLADGTTPAEAMASSAAGTVDDSRLWFPLNGNSFVNAPSSTYGLGNAQPTMFWGSGTWTLNTSMSKSFTVREGKTMEFRAETFNTLNHFNPGDPNTTRTYNWNTGKQTNGNFGVITGGNGGRTMAVSLRFKF